jgi:cytochrome c-type biogenesis protein CcmF
LAELGRAALIVSFVLALYAFVVGTAAARTKQRRLADSARNALIFSFFSTLIAAVILARALVEHNFSFQYVAQHTSRDLSTVYSLTAFWGGEEGSLLLWLLVLTGYAALAVTLNRRLLRDVVTWVVPVMGGIATFFSFMLVAVASPFVTIPRAVDGAGLVPSLQNPYMVAHPPLLYLGYVGLSVPFAFAAGAMLSGQTDERWIVATRRWTLAAWTFLGFGQLLGAHWAYLEVGWGGYYSWDPVEIAALMPWLVATAFLHSVMIQERKGMLRVWNMVLVAFAFNLSLFGTFLTRSGVVNSIHSFAKSSIGAWFLGMVVASSLFSTALIIWRLPLLRARTKLESAISREAAFLYNNLLFVALCLTLLWGEVFPILTQYVEGYQRTMGRPYFDFFLRIFGLPLLLLMGIGPLVAWRRASGRALLRTLRWPLGASILTGIALIAIGDGSSSPGLIAYSFSVFALTSIVVELVRGTRATGSLFELIGRNRRRYGGYIVHAAIVLFVIGVVGSSDYSTTRERQLARGQSMTVDGYTVTFRGLVHSTSNTVSGSSVTTTAELSVKGRLHLNMGTSSNDSSALGVSRMVGVRTDWWRAEDLYTILDSVQGKGPAQTAFIIVEVEPLVNLIWIAGFIFLGGSLVAMWPDAREQRRLATRLSLARA